MYMHSRWLQSHDIQEMAVPPHCSIANIAKTVFIQGNYSGHIHLLAVMMSLLRYELILFITLTCKNVQHSIIFPYSICIFHIYFYILAIIAKSFR